LLSDLGSGPHRLKPSCVPVARISSSSAAGRTLFADSYGNLITNLKEDSLPSPKPDGLKVLVNDGRIAVNWVGTYGEAHPGALVALLGSSGRIELSQVNGNASKVFPTIGTTIEIRW